MTSFMERLKLSYNILRDRHNFEDDPGQIIVSSSPSATYTRVRYDSSDAVLAPIVTRIAVDVASIPIRHVLVDERDQFVEIKKSELNDRLSIMANIDQSGEAFIQDAATSMLQNGACVLVPIEISSGPDTGSYDILSMRVGRVVQWFNRSVEVEVYNEIDGERTEVVVPKSFVAIAYNPFYALMNEANSTLRRLQEKLALLDVADGRLYSNQLDLILQLPFTLKNEKRESEAQRRLEILENQLYDRKYGIGYIDATEKITQLNRPVTNDLVATVQGLTTSLYSQLGLTESIFLGTATQEEMVAYNNRTLLPIVHSLTDAMRGAFFSRTAIRQGNSVMGLPNLFKMAPLEVFADAADKLTRNEIMSSNEVRAVVGLPPSKEPDADSLRNKNLNKSESEIMPQKTNEEESTDENNNKE